MRDSNEIVDESNECGCWEWFACDGEDRIGYFNNLGMRHLPKTIKANKQMVERLEVYFSEEIADRCKWVLRESVEVDLGGWEKIPDKQEFLRFWGGISGKGLFVYKSQNIFTAETADVAKHLGVFSPATEHIYDLDGTASYYLVAIPGRPLHISDLPEEIAQMVSRVRSPFPFGVTTHFSEVETMKW